MKIELTVSSFAGCYEGAELKDTQTWQAALIDVLKENEIMIDGWQEDSSAFAVK